MGVSRSNQTCLCASEAVNHVSFEDWSQDQPHWIIPNSETDVKLTSVSEFDCHGMQLRLW